MLLCRAGRAGAVGGGTKILLAGEACKETDAGSHRQTILAQTAALCLSFPVLTLRALTLIRGKRHLESLESTRGMKA